jgi:hypothetical protein
MKASKYFREVERSLDYKIGMKSFKVITMDRNSKFREKTTFKCIDIRG